MSPFTMRKRSRVEQIEGPARSARRPQHQRFPGVASPPRPGRRRAPSDAGDRRRQVVQVDDHPVHARGGQPADLPADEGLAGDGQRRFGAQRRQRRQPRAEPGGQDRARCQSPAGRRASEQHVGAGHGARGHEERPVRRRHVVGGGEAEPRRHRMNRRRRRPRSRRRCRLASRRWRARRRRSRTPRGTSRSGRPAGSRGRRAGQQCVAAGGLGLDLFAGFHWTGQHRSFEGEVSARSPSAPHAERGAGRLQPAIGGVDEHVVLEPPRPRDGDVQAEDAPARVLDVREPQLDLALDPVAQRLLLADGDEALLAVAQDEQERGGRPTRRGRARAPPRRPTLTGRRLTCSSTSPRRQSRPLRRAAGFDVADDDAFGAGRQRAAAAPSRG